MKSKFIALSIFILNLSDTQAQIINNPEYDRSTDSNVTINRIEITDYNTIITFVYKASDMYVNGGWFNMSPSVYLKSSDGRQKYKLIKADGIPLAPEKKQFDYAGQIVSYRLIFPKVDKNIEKIDIIESDASNAFNFYGVSLSFKNKDNIPPHQEAQKFRKDYNYVSYYDPETQKWSDWQEWPNTFVFNINENGDFKLFKAKGQPEIFRKVSAIKEGHTDDGKKYQAFDCLNEDGNECSLQLFDFGDAKLIFSTGILLQFTNISNNK